MRASFTPGALALALAAFLTAQPLPALADAAGRHVQASAPEPSVPEGRESSGLSQELEPDPLLEEDFEDFGGPEVYDPFENGNRAVFRFNQGIDRYFWNPITGGYRFLVPRPARRAVRRVFSNLNMPVYLVNHLLRARFDAAGETLAAFVMNSTFGVGGIFDAASRVGLESHPADFGQTLALAGVGTGPYLVIPIFGPSTVRDGVGGVIDRLFHPLTYFLPIYPQQILLGSGMGFARREEAGEKLSALEESAVDFYAVLRSAYVQAREQSIEDCRRDSRGDPTQTVDAEAPADDGPAPESESARPLDETW